MIDTWRYFNPDVVKYSSWSYKPGQREKDLGWRADYFLASGFVFLEEWQTKMTTLADMMNIAKLPTVLDAEICT